MLPALFELWEQIIVQNMECCTMGTSFDFISIVECCMLLEIAICFCGFVFRGAISFQFARIKLDDNHYNIYRIQVDSHMWMLRNTGIDSLILVEFATQVLLTFNVLIVFGYLLKIAILISHIPILKKKNTRSNKQRSRSRHIQELVCLITQHSLAPGDFCWKT